MKSYLISLGAGLLVGLIYSLLHVRSPAPPLIALIGLLGIVIGEQALPIARRLSASVVTLTWLQQECAPHVLGRLPTGKSSTLACGAPVAPGTSKV